MSSIDPLESRHWEIDITVRCPDWAKALPNYMEMATKALKLVFFETVPAISGEISLVLADDPFVQNLNKTFRNKDKPTNVLSFPQTGIGELEDESPFFVLGDIVMAYETISREAQEQNKSLRDHFCHMLVHGCLHLLHYDHETENDADEMEALEVAILHKLGINNPYAITD